MNCPNCNAKVEDGALFCAECGAKIENSSTQNNITAEENSKVQAPESTGAKKKNSKVKILVPVLAAVIVVAVIAVILLTGKTTVDLNKYGAFEFSGYDTVGHGTFSFDWDQFEADYADKIKLTSAGDSAIGEWSVLYKNAAEMLDMYVSAYESYSDLSNGDTVTYTWDVAVETIEKYFNIKVKYDDVTQTVSGLDPIEEVDVFVNVEVTVTGTSPNGEAYVSVDDEYLNASDFTLSKDSGLSNGDTVTVELNSDAEKSMSYRGEKPTATSKTYTISIPELVTSLDQLTEDLAEEYDDKVEEIYDYEKYWDETYVTLISREYVTDYLMLNTENGEVLNNMLYFVYEIAVQQDGLEMTYYWYVGFGDVTIDDSGKCEINTDNHVQPYVDYWSEDGTAFSNTSYSVSNGIQTITYTGYQTLSELYEDLIAGNDEYDTYEGTEYTSADDSQTGAKEAQIIEGAQEYNGHYYFVIGESLTWSEAEAICENFGGHLATITNAGEQNFVNGLAEYTVWIGAHLNDNGAWSWVTGETWSYENWHEGEPSGGDECCVCMYGEDDGGEWNDGTDDNWGISGFVCEWD